MRPLINEAAGYDSPSLLEEWKWLVPQQDTPLFLTVFGDWVFGAPDGTLWCLSLLEGKYEKIASDGAEYNALKRSREWLDKTFIAGWQEIALRHGLDPTRDQCLGWKLHPLLGGKFEVANLRLFDMVVYQSLQGQLHRQLRARSQPPQPLPPENKPWYKLW